MKNTFRNTLAAVITAGSVFSVAAAPPQTPPPLTPEAKAVLRLYATFELCVAKKMSQGMTYTADERTRGEREANKFFVYLNRHDMEVVPEKRQEKIDDFTQKLAAESRCEKDMGVTIDAILKPYYALFEAGHSIPDVLREMNAAKRKLQTADPK
jgi:hypothetical protein